MVEEIEKEKQKTEITIAEDMLSKALKAAERLEAANSQSALLIKRQEELMAMQALSGKSMAGQQPAPVDPEKEIKSKCLKMLEGTGLNPFK